MAQETKESKKSPHDGHKERMRERFIKSGGFIGFSDHEILELLLNYILVRTNTNGIAHDLITTFGSLEAVLDAEPHELVKVPGVGERTAVFISFQRELLRLYGQRKFEADNKKPIFDDKYINAGFFQYMSTLYAGVDQERCYMMFVDAKGRLSNAEILGEGSSECILINQKKLLKEAIASNAAGVVLVHNHVTGIALPSNADVENTLKIRDSLEVLGIDLVDHFVYTQKGCVSILHDARCKYRK